MQTDLNALIELVSQWFLLAIGAVVVLLIGRWIAHKVGNSIEALLNKTPNSDPTLSRFFASLIKFIILAATVMAALTVVGVDTTSFSAVILGLGAAMAFILQGSLSNIAAGVMLMLFRPFNIGDEISGGGVSGKVTDISLTAVRLKSTDNREFIISNSAIWGGTIKNMSALGERRLDMVFGISYDADINKAIEALKDVASAHPSVFSKPEPWAKVVNLNESSVDIELRVWCKAADYRGLKVSLPQPVKAAFDAAGIGIPYPHEIKHKEKIKSSKARDRVVRLTKLRNS